MFRLQAPPCPGFVVSHAQKYLEKFYNNLGFKTIGESYLEDGIPHIAMIKY
jgi:predicted GNAT family N-acyltransferase